MSMFLILTVFIIAGLMFMVELWQPGRQWQQVSGWWGRALLLNGVQVASVFIAGIAWDKWMVGHGLWNSEAMLGTNISAILGYVVITFIYYWWHRARHEVDFLWRWFHQVHHSAQRIEVITSFYKHPLEILFNSALSSAILYVLLGLSPEAAAIAILMTGVAELFYHWNVNTPYWLGFIIQRPESHCVHHQRDWHRNNFSDLPIWDMMFGTFQNPKNFEPLCGFHDDRERSLGKMLTGKDVNK